MRAFLKMCAKSGKKREEDGRCLEERNNADAGENRDNRGGKRKYVAGRGERQSGKTGENKKTETGVGDKSEGGNTNEDGDGRKK